jgi:endoglucanase
MSHMQWIPLRTSRWWYVATGVGAVAALAIGTWRVTASPEAQGAVPPIRVNQVGYLPDAPKVAIAVGASTGGTARVQRETGPAIDVPLSAPTTDPQTGDVVRSIDFTRITTPGTYVLSVDALGQADSIHIAADVYRRPLYLAVRSFYGQRCGTAVDLGSEFPGYRYAACHLDDGQFHASSGKTGSRAAPKGWHDAGDYGKYVVNSGITTGELIWAWEWYPSVFAKLRLDIPESANDTPDLLDEIRWNLEWMMAMQDEDGGVWHKLTSERFGSFVLPNVDDGRPRYVIGTGSAPYKSTCASGDFAAVLAAAARAYRPYDREFANRTLAAARRAWTWTEQNPNVIFRNPAGVQTGEYGDADCTDERLWAAAELFRTTGEPAFEAVARTLASKFSVGTEAPQAWPQVANLGLWSYALATTGADGETQRRIREETVAAARTIADRTRRSGWRHSLTTKNFVWGSNGVVADYGVLLLVASRFSREPVFREAALDNLHYLLGRNTFGLSWVTGVGVRPFQHPHHRPSGGDQNGAPWPGLLSGGPNASSRDPGLDRLPKDVPPGRRYIDHQDSYASNENAINWNAALVFLLAGVQLEEK